MAGTIGMGLASQAAAAVVFSYVADSTSYPTGSGTANTVKVYLKEDLTNGSQSVLTANGNLFSAGVQLCLNPGQGTTGLATITGVTPNRVDFGGPTVQSLAPGAASFTVAATPGTTSGVHLGNIAGGTSTTTPANEVYLGSFTVTSGIGGVFTLKPYDTAGGNTLDFASDDLDFNSLAPAYTGTSSATPFTITFPIGPEPASLGLVALGAAAVARRGRHKVLA